MENSILKYFSGFCICLLIILILALIRRNSTDTYWVTFWFMSPLIPLFFFFLFCIIFSKSNNEKIAGLIFSSLFLLFIIISLSENNKIKDGEIINSAMFREKKTIRIKEIETITFSFSTEPVGLILKVKTKYSTLSINSQIENVDVFFSKIKELNANIIIIGNKKHGLTGLVLLNLLTIIMLTYTFKLVIDKIF